MSITRSRVNLLAVLCVGTLAWTWWADDDESLTLDQRQSEERVESLRLLDVQRSGSVRLRLFDARGASGSPHDRDTVAYVLRAPHAVVEDTDIRGHLDGTTKYDFNQGTSYHMRVGRRYGGAYRGAFELKRSLLRWRLPDLPTGSRVISMRLRLWVERFLTDSPLARSRNPFPLHLYVYPIVSSWDAGRGGVQRDDFSAPAPGEASWMEGEAGRLAWPAPGALPRDVDDPNRPYSIAPLAVAMVDRSDYGLEIESEALVDHLESRIRDGRTFDVLLKLDDQEEDRWGTEFAFLSSEFGDDRDVVSKRPTLEFDIEMSMPAAEYDWDFVLEPGTEFVLPPVRGDRSMDSLLVVAELSSDRLESTVPPQIYMRGGSIDDTTASAWVPVHGPAYVDWDWLQLKVSAAPNPIAWGDRFEVRLLETWVQPEPREQQVPELALIAPSGKVHRVAGRPDGPTEYVLTFTPTELGLWRYGWSFRPTPVRPLGGHQGEGVFHVGVPTGEDRLVRLAQMAEHVADIADDGPPRRKDYQTKLNGFIRWASSVRAEPDATASAIADSLIHVVRASAGR